MPVHSDESQSPPPRCWGFRFRSANSNFKDNPIPMKQSPFPLGDLASGETWHKLSIGASFSLPHSSVRLGAR